MPEVSDAQRLLLCALRRASLVSPQLPRSWWASGRFPACAQRRRSLGASLGFFYQVCKCRAERLRKSLEHDDLGRLRFEPCSAPKLFTLLVRSGETSCPLRGNMLHLPTRHHGPPLLGRSAFGSPMSQGRDVLGVVSDQKSRSSSLGMNGGAGAMQQRRVWLSGRRRSACTPGAMHAPWRRARRASPSDRRFA